jgi:hypothetical protein
MEAKVDYTSDYPEGWHYSSGDPFKFPVLIGVADCFIKRFEKKYPASITGWELLRSLKGKNNSNIARVYDIKEEIENEVAVHYVFYEFIRGQTLNTPVSLRMEGDLQRLADDVLTGLSVIHGLGYWFSDFCEKNIFWDKDGRFLLIDLDSAFPVTDKPKIDMDGSKEFWIYVQKFYREQLQMPDMTIARLYGPSLNYLQLIFLVLKSKWKLVHKEKVRHQDMEEWLIGQLTVMAPEVTDLFMKLKGTGAQLPDQDTIKMMKQVAGRIISAPDDMFVAPAKPTIVISDDRETKLSRGGERERVRVREKRTEIKKNEEKKIRVDRKDHAIWKNRKAKLFILSGAGVLAVLLLVFALKFNRTFRIRTSAVFQDSSIVIRVHNYPDLQKIHVYFDEQEATQTIISTDESIAHVPELRAATGKSEVKIVIKGPDGKTLLSEEMEYVPVSIADMKWETLLEDSTLTLTGKRLDSKALAIFFNHVRAPVVSAGFDTLVVRVPDMGDMDIMEGNAESRIKVQLQARRNDSIVLLEKLGELRETNISLMDLAPSAQWEGGISGAGKEISQSSDDIQPGTNFQAIERLHFPAWEDDGHGVVRIDRADAEDGRTYRLLRTYPKSVKNGSIRGIIRPGNGWFRLQQGKKTFRSVLGYASYTGGSSNYDGLNFQVYIHFVVNGRNMVRQILDVHKKYDADPIVGRGDIPSMAGEGFFVELRVNTGSNPNTDSAVWINPSICLRKISFKN